MVPIMKLTEFGDRANDSYSNKVYTLKIYNVNIKDNCHYKLRVTYTEGLNVSVVNGTIVLRVNGKI